MADISFFHDDAIGYIDEPPSCQHDFDVFGPDLDLPPSDPDLDLDLRLGFCIDSHSMGAAADEDDNEIDDYSSGFLLADCGEESLVWKRENVFFEDDEEIESNSIDLNPIFSEINEAPAMDLIPVFEDFEWQQVDRRVDEREAMTIFFDDDMDDDVDVEISVATEDQSRQIGNNSDWEILLNNNNNTQNSDPNPDEEEDDFEMLAAVEVRKPPASKAAIEGLTVAVVMEGQDSLCAICKDEIGIGEKGKFMPCSHFYHGFCIDTWLEMRNTCPVCRHELPTDDDEYERRRVEREDQESRRVGEVRFFI